MLGLSLVRPLEDDWRETLDVVARHHNWPTSADVARLAERVSELSAAYNDPSRARSAMREGGAARLGFAFPRDVPKGAAAVRELIATGALGLGGRAPEVLRVLDLGAGLGASTWGVARALAAAGSRGTIEATWVEADAEALAVGREIVDARAPRDGVALRVRTLLDRVEALEDLGQFDLVLGAQVLSELDVGAPSPARIDRHAALVASWLERRVDPRGSLVVVEPALRDRARHLHRVRDALAARSGVAIFAPCLHAAYCPALAREGDWCHEDLPVDLPSWLVPVARAAGLRREGLTFSYLVLRRDGARLADAFVTEAAPRPARLRVVSGGMPSKGKREAFVCGELAHRGELVPARARLMRLERDARAENALWQQVARGDLLAIRPAPELERPRIGAHSVVDVGIGREEESR
jgi:hypothetical protein